MAVLQAFFYYCNNIIGNYKKVIRKMGNIDNINIFKDTEKHCKTNEKLKNSLENSIRKQELILEADIIEKPDCKNMISEQM